MQATTVSVAATVELVTVNVPVFIVEGAAAVNSVICPVVLFRVTPVVRLVPCVTVPPAPVE